MQLKNISPVTKCSTKLHRTNIFNYLPKVIDNFWMRNFAISTILKVYFLVKCGVTFFQTLFRRVQFSKLTTTWKTESIISYLHNELNRRNRIKTNWSMTKFDWNCIKRSFAVKTQWQAVSVASIVPKLLLIHLFTAAISERTKFSKIEFHE